MVNRLVKPFKLHSYFLFGNRGVGKSTLLQSLFPKTKSIWFDLLDYETEKKLALNPGLLKQQLDELRKKFPKNTFVIIDEIQKNPKLLDSVHGLIEQKYFHFILTGSSARKLKKQGVNLLAGRAFISYLFPFTHAELGKKFNLDHVLKWGSLPKIFDYKDDDLCLQYLNSYADAYLREEIIAEQIVRNITPFRHFLEVAAQSQARIVNYSNISRDVGVDVTTVQNYFQILEDTFTGVLLQPYDQSLRNRQRKNPKFYYFDIGVGRALQNKLTLPLDRRSYEYGDLFEQFVILECIRLNSYYGKNFKFSYLKTQSDVEVDLVIERPGKSSIFIEIKSTDSILSLNQEKLNGFRKIVEDSKKTEGWVLSQDSTARVEGGIRIIPWKLALAELFEP